MSGITKLASRSEENASSASSNDIIIAVMGTTGSGKSSFIRLATGNDQVIIGHGLQPCTSEIQAFSCLYPGNSGDSRRNVIFLDTPGFNIGDRAYPGDADIPQDVDTFLARTYKKGAALTVWGGTLGRSPHMFRKLWAVCGIHNFILVTTMWDSIQEAQGMDYEGELTKTEPWSLMMKAGSSVLRFESSHESAWSIVDQFTGVGPLGNLVIQLDKLRVKSQSELWHLRCQDGNAKFPNSLSSSTDFPPIGEPRGKLSATILALRDARDVAKIYRLPSFKDAVNLCLALTESIEALNNTEQALISFAESAGELIVEIANLIHNGKVPEGTKLAELVGDIVTELENFDTERLLRKRGSRLGRVRQYILH